MAILSSLVSASGKEQWFSQSGPEGDVVLSSRIQLTRNVANFPFPASMSPDQHRIFLSEIDLGIRGLFPAMGSLGLRGCPPTDLSLLSTWGFISRNATKADVLFIDEEHLDRGILVNYHDHLTIFALAAGLCPEHLLTASKQLEVGIEQRFPLAASSEFGFLTSRVKYAGLGLRYSALLHLPGISRMKGFDELLPLLQSQGLSLRFFSPNPEDNLSSVYLLSGQSRFGQGEHEFLEILADLVLELVHYERKVREDWRDDDPLEFDDHMWRALGILTTSRRMGLDESLSLLSWTRMGAGMKILEIPVPLLTRAFFLTQDEPVRRLAAPTEGLSGEEEKSSTFSPHVTILEEERSRQLRRVLSGG